MQRQNSVDVTLIGAGIGGLSTALALQRRGYRVAIYEQAAVLGEVGAGVMLSPNATRILRQWGLLESLERIGYRPRFTTVRDGLSGEELSTSLLGQDGFHADGSPFLHLHRADLYALLLAAVRDQDPSCIHLGWTLTDVTQDDKVATATFGTANAFTAPCWWARMATSRGFANTWQKTRPRHSPATSRGVAWCRRRYCVRNC
jgi:2-polyprenyl-6-methoxyphenol hydroxylase-like FAD-dependent oxidoreductase